MAAETTGQQLREDAENMELAQKINASYKRLGVLAQQAAKDGQMQVTVPLVDLGGILHYVAMVATMAEADARARGQIPEGPGGLPS